MDLSVIVLLLGMVALGFRHGFDWDHIAAITDITSTTTAGHAEVDVPASSPVTPHGHDAGEMRAHVHQHAVGGPSAAHAFGESRFAHEQRHAIGLASLYALGHASVVVLLGVLALTLGAVLPDWVDPILEKVVGVTLLLLGAWVIYSVVQYLRGKGEFRLRSRWMLVFDGVRYGWRHLQARIHGHEHVEPLEMSSYGARTAFSVGMIHGIGAETGTQVLLIAAVGGAASAGLAIPMLVAFVVGLLLSNFVIVVVSSVGFVASQARERIYVAVGAVAGTFSLVLGVVFLLSLDRILPDLESLLPF